MLNLSDGFRATRHKWVSNNKPGPFIDPCDELGTVNECNGDVPVPPCTLSWLGSRGLRPFDPRALGASVGRKLFGELHLEIPLHFVQGFTSGQASR